VWNGLAKPYEGQTNKRGLRPVGWAMFNATRVEAGRPLYGIDFTDASLPAETGQFDRAVSVTKGCYLGQEVVARMYARQQVAKALVGLRMVEDALPTAGAEILNSEGVQVGTVTSSTLSPVLGGACLALGTVKKGFFDPGTELKVPAEGAMRGAKVVPLPFIPK
jgi:folate-binding protein YgfZ